MTNKTLFTILLLISFCLQTRAQLSILDKNGIEKIKNGRTYIIIGSSNSPSEDEFLKVFKKYWTLSKGIDYIKKADIKTIIKPGDSFFSLQSYRTYSNSTFDHSYNTHTQLFNMVYLWVPEKSYFKKNRELKASDMDGIARIDLAGTGSTLAETYVKGDSMQTDTTAFEGGSRFFNWSPGMLKIYLKQITAALQAHKSVSFGDEITNKEQLKTLATQTLYCNQDDFNKMSAFSKSNNGNIDNAGEVFKDYAFKYEAVSNKELDEKILKDEEPIYYLLFVRSSFGKLVAVINSQSGEVIYSRHQSMSWNLKSGDLKSLYKKVR